MNLTNRRWVLLLILWITAVFRLYGLNNISPPGLEHDEVANWLIDRSILDGHHAIYFTQAYGHEAGFHYLQTAFVALLGDHALALRLPAAFTGILLVAVTFALARRLFGWQVAITAMGLTAVLFYPIFYSRLALRAITLPLMSGLSAYFWWRWWNGKAGEQGSVASLTGAGESSPPHPFTPSPLRPLLLSALFAGLSLHTYMAARAVPIFYGLFCAYLALFHWQDFKMRWRSILLFWVIYVAIAAPLLIYLQTNPSAEFRITEIDMPLRELQAGNMRPVLANSLKIAGMFGFAGDPLWRQNVAGQPVFEPIVAILFYAGVLFSLWRWRDGRYAFILLWSLASFAPSIATVDAPSSIRIVNILPILTLFPSLLIHKIGQLSTVIHNLSTKYGSALLTIGFAFYMGWTAYALFIVWPQNDEVGFVWQRALAATAVYLDTSPSTDPVAIGGWSPNTMDEPTMQLMLRRHDLDLRYFGSDSETEPINTLILPAGDAVRIVHPAVRPLASALQTKLAQWGALAQTEPAFTLYTVNRDQLSVIRNQSPVSFNNEIRFLAYEPVAGGILTIWQVITPTDKPRRFFAHALNQSGDIVAQHDSLDAPAKYWQPGDLLVQYHPLDATGVTHLRLGIYNPDTCPACQNPRTDDGTEFVLIRP
jgi:4-amino-4-deoxy-L-arabinose transferase-like glycosyltransferase